MLKIGERIKELRKAQDVTQERLADYLNISYQAVSKWENGLALPDITLIPALSGFFGVSADYLFGIDTEYSDKVIENVLGEVSRLKHIAKAEEGIALIEKTLRSYPNNHKLLAEWVELKVHTFETNCEKKEWLKQIEDKANIVLHDSNDDFIRYKAKLALTLAYSFCEERVKAEKLCDTFPDEPYSRTDMYSMTARPQERVKYKRRCICCDLEKLLVDILSIAKHYYCFADPKDAIPVCDIALNIINSIGNEGFLVSYSAEAYSDLANAYAKLKDKDSVIANMKAAFKEYLKIDCLVGNGDYLYTSPLLNGEVFNKEKVEYYAPISATEEYIQRVSQMRSYDWLRNDLDFITLLGDMKSKAVRYDKENSNC